MIFLTVGTELPFDRLVRAVDVWIGAHPGVEIVAQVGRSKYQTRFFTPKQFLTAEEFDEAMQNCKCIVSHAGMGTIISALSAGKPLIVMPREASCGEHRNDHQLATATAFNRRGYVHVAVNADQLHRILEEREVLPLPSPIPPTASAGLLEAVREFVCAPKS